jgi:glutamate---cysteine ligase / carboxylate-amine ligase
MAVPTLGVEEELLLVDPDTALVTSVAAEAVRAHDDASKDAGSDAAVEAELFLQQVETKTPPCTTLDELERELRHSRRAVCEAAEAAGAAAAALAVPVLMEEDSRVTRQPRYLRIREEYGDIAASALTCAMHVHVSVDTAEEAVRVLDRIQPWLPVLLAMSANSPYTDAHDTGHDSWRAQAWGGWPSHGTGQPFGDVATYEEVTERLVDWGAALDPAMAYFDARHSHQFDTVEVRVADVCADVEDAVLVAGLTRALVATAIAAEPAEEDPWRSELLRAATWRASRYGIAGRLVDPSARELAPARDVVASLLGHVRPALDEAGDLRRVQDLVERLFAQGNGATRQRRTFEESGNLEDVVLDAVERTRTSAADH